MISGLRPGVVIHEKPAIELQRQRDEIEDYWKNEGENEELSPEKVDQNDAGIEILGRNICEGESISIEKNRSNDTDLETQVVKSNAVLDEEEGPSRTENKEEDKYEQPPFHFCHKCNIVQGYRTRHCKSCETCIAKFDHHCFWIGKIS